MLRFQIALAIILVGCIALLSCGRGQEMLEDPVTEETPPEMMTEMMTEMVTEAAHKSWAHVTLPAPTMTVEEAAAAMNPGGTGAAHGMGSRTVYFNEIGAMANKAGIVSPAEYPVGTMIYKEVMDATEAFIVQIVTMMKTDDPMYAAHNGWMYGMVNRTSATDMAMPNQLAVEMSGGCHGCHVKAAKTTDSVFVALSTEQTMEEDTTDDGTTDDGTTDDGTTDDGTTDDGTTDDGTTDDGTTDDGTTDDGTTDDGTTDDGTTDDGASNGNGNGAAQ